MKDSSVTPSVRSASTRAALLDAFERLLSRSELAACTTTAIAAEAGFAAGTFYTHFPDRNAALAELFAARLDVIVDAVAAALTADRLLDDGLEAAIEAAVSTTVHGYRSHSAVLRAALATVSSDPRVRRVYWERHAASIDALLRFLRRGAAAGLVRADRHRSLAHTVLLTLQGLNSPIVLTAANPRLVAGIRRDVTVALTQLLRPPPAPPPR